MSSVAPCPLVTAVTQAKKELRFERLSPEWQPSAFSKYSTRFICFHTGHKRKENWKAFTLMATKCLFKILYQIYLFPHRSQKKEKIKRLSLSVFFLKFICFQTGLLTCCTSRGWTPKGQRYQWRITCRVQRGACLSRLTDMWLSTWGEEEEVVEWIWL